MLILGGEQDYFLDTPLEVLDSTLQRPEERSSCILGLLVPAFVPRQMLPYHLIGVAALTDLLGDLLAYLPGEASHFLRDGDRQLVGGDGVLHLFGSMIEDAQIAVEVPAGDAEAQTDLVPEFFPLAVGK